jgi:energy-coupling factor transporter ATP-binding protein EcfA2
MITKSTVNTNPFPGLRPFEEDENYLFFGRETQVDQMLGKLQRNRFLAVIGTSGSGKSSLVNCGLFPALHGGYLPSAGSSWRIAKFRPGNDPIREMALAITEKGTLFIEEKIGKLPLSSIVHINLLRSKLGLVETYKQARLKPHENLLVVVDQFEELFRYQNLRGSENEDAAVSFVNLLLEAVKQSELPIYVVITMRSDFLGDCSRFRGLPETINEGQYLVPRMKRNERKSAIAGPVEVAGASITERLLMRLVNDVGDNPDQLSILQHALNRTWAAWENEEKPATPLDLPHYQKIGTMSKALDQHAEKAFHELPDERHKLVCQKIFKALTDVGTDSRGVRRPTQMQKLCMIAEATHEEVQAVINVFRKPSRSFLMPPADTDLEENTIVDISHESFMRIWKRLIRWTKEEQESVRTYLRLSDAAMLYGEGKTALMTDPYLQFALNWKEDEKVNQAWAERYDDNFTAVMDYIRKSRRDKQLKEAEAKATAEAEQKRKDEEQRKKVQRARKFNMIFGAFGAVCLVLLVIATILYFNADAAKQKATLAQIESDSLKAEILHRMGFTEEQVGLDDLDEVFKLKDIQENIKMVENGSLSGSDTELLAQYNILLSDEFNRFLIDSTRDRLTQRAGILSNWNELQAIDQNPDIILAEKLAQWGRYTSFKRNTPEHSNGLEKLAAYQDARENQAFLANDSLIFILENAYTSTNRDSLPTALAKKEFTLGNGKSIHVWLNGENKNARLEFYAGDQRIGSRSIADGGFPTWTQQYFNPEYAGRSGQVKVFNRKGDLIGQQTFALLK